MKARYNPLNKRERKMAKGFIRQNLDELLDIRGLLITYRTIAMIAIALNEKFGFGKKRLCELIYQIGIESSEQQEWIKDGAGDPILFKHLRKIGLGILAEQIEEEQKKVDEIYTGIGAESEEGR